MAEQRVMTVSEFIKSLNLAFEEALFPYGATVEGEVVEYRVSQGKWIWFNLKDEESIISCFATVWQLRQPLEDGMRIRAHGLPRVHPKSGKFSLNVDRVELVGEGALRRSFELLKKKLEAEGIFAPERKRTVPRFPEKIGLIASRESAAYSDFLRILSNRWGGMSVLSAHVQVQGRDAVSDIVGAFNYFNRDPKLADVLVLTRGGGSLEDLQAFNSEEVARAVFSSKIPVVVAVGHERDESLADYAADLRASTPSNAAERLVPDRRDVERELAGGVRLMEQAMRDAVSVRERRLFEMESHLQDHVRSARAEFDAVMSDLHFRLAGFGSNVAALLASVERDERLLKSLDPQAVLKRGYGIVRDAAGRLVRDAASVDIGSEIRVQLQRGTLEAEVTDRT